jgi:hypothetical protein
MGVSGQGSHRREIFSVYEKDAIGKLHTVGAQQPPLQDHPLFVQADQMAGRNIGIGSAVFR